MKATATSLGVLVLLLAITDGGRGADSLPAIKAKAAPSATQPSAPREALTLDLGNKVTMDLVLIPAGKFVMSSPKDEKGRLDNEGAQREVTISRPFYLGIYHVTQEQYGAIMGANPSKFKGAINPAEQVSWNDAETFCKKASAKTGRKFRLPTEAEWEYACRAGSKTRFSFGDDDKDLGENAWFDGNSNKTTHPVGQKKPNAFGLYDMHGNVWQWCSDWYSDSSAGVAEKDPEGPKSRKNHVLRGGAWLGDPRMCRSAFRTSSTPVIRSGYFGFRVVADFQ